MIKPVIVGSGIAANSLVAGSTISASTIDSLTISEKLAHEEEVYNNLIDLPKNVSMFADADGDTAYEKYRIYTYVY